MGGTGASGRVPPTFVRSWCGALTDDRTDHYAGAGRRWAGGAIRVYRPIADELVDMSPHSLAGRVVLDVGAGTGAASAALKARGARPMAVDRSFDMLAAFDDTSGVPRAIADVRALPIATDGVDDCIAAFVLNHLPDPEMALQELRRVARPTGAILATVYSNASHSPARDRVDQVAVEAGWQVPDWYLEVKNTTAPLLGSAPAMEAAARAVGLVDVTVEERPVDVGVTDAAQLVAYRYSQGQFTHWLDRLGATEVEALHHRAAETVRPIMEPFRPIVVFLSAQVPK